MDRNESALTWGEQPEAQPRRYPEMTLTDLDTLRAETMHALLTDEGRQHIWKYDIVPLRAALAMANEDQNYDDITTNIAGLQAGHKYALIGGGICDHPFTTPAELIALVKWLCETGYLSCYAAAKEQTNG